MAGSSRERCDVARSDGGSMPRPTLSICLRCRDGREDARGGERGGARLAKAALEADIADAGLAVRGVHCMSQCKRPCAVALSGPGRFTYMFGDLDPLRHADDLVTLAALYSGSTDGFMSRDARPAPMRAGVLGRIPPLDWRGDSVEILDLATPSPLETYP